LRFTFVVAAYHPSTPHSSGFAHLASGAFYTAIDLATFYEIILFGSSANSLIEYFRKTRLRPGRKGRLRRQHRRDILAHIPRACVPQSEAGPEKKNFGGTRGNPRHNLEGTSAL